MEVTTTAGQDHGPKRQTTMTPRPDRVEPAANAALDAPGTRIAGVVLLFLTAHLAGGGCGEQRGPEPASGGAEPIQSVAVPGTPSIATPDTPPGTPAPPFTGTESPIDRPAGVMGVATQTGIRVARQEGYDRVVFEFASNGLPGYHVAYTDEPVTQCGSGAPVTVAGDGRLLVRMTPARAHDDAGNATITERALAPGLPVVTELALICDFEAHLDWVIGVAAPNHYRVLELRDPTRLVVDILHR